MSKSLKITFIVFLILVLLIFVPIPIKIYLKYINNVLTIKIYNFKVKLNKKESIEIREKAKQKMHKIQKINYRGFIYAMTHSKLKPSLILSIDMAYGLDDAAYTGILYGLIYSLYGISVQYIENIVKLKKFNFKLSPDFDEVKFYIELSSIISISLAQVIYIILSFLKYVSIKKKNKNYNSKFDRRNEHG